MNLCELTKNHGVYYIYARVARTDTHNVTSAETPTVTPDVCEDICLQYLLHSWLHRRYTHHYANRYTHVTPTVTPAATPACGCSCRYAHRYTLRHCTHRYTDVRRRRLDLYAAGGGRRALAPSSSGARPGRDTLIL